MSKSSQIFALSETLLQDQITTSISFSLCGLCLVLKKTIPWIVPEDKIYFITLVYSEYFTRNGFQTVCDIINPIF